MVWVALLFVVGFAVHTFVFEAVASLLIKLSKRTPYWHLMNADGSVYMERFWLIRSRGPKWGWGVRIHHIVTADSLREMHDHPGSFLSVVLKGGYVEERPADPRCVDWEGVEPRTLTARGVGSVAFRRATDRHTILSVQDETWTLFITGPSRQWWGFYTPTGKIYWKKYLVTNGKRGV